MGQAKMGSLGRGVAHNAALQAWRPRPGDSGHWACSRADGRVCFVRLGSVARRGRLAGAPRAWRRVRVIDDLLRLVRVASNKPTPVTKGRILRRASLVWVRLRAPQARAMCSRRGRAVERTPRQRALGRARLPSDEASSTRRSVVGRYSGPALLRLTAPRGFEALGSGEAAGRCSWRRG